MGFFSFSKWLWFLVRPDHVLVWWLSAGVIALYLHRRRLALWLLSVEAVALLLLALFPLGNYLMYPLESRFPEPDLSKPVAGVLILGGGEQGGLSAVWQTPLFNEAAERFMVVPMLARRFPDAQIVFSGGSGAYLNQRAKGADVAKAWFDEIGLGERVHYEGDSRNTDENFRNTLLLLGGVPKGRWLLVTSGFHMPRSVGIARQQGWDITPYPVDFYSSGLSGWNYDPMLWNHLRELTIATHEWIGLVSYYVSGKSAELFPAPHPDAQ